MSCHCKNSTLPSQANLIVIFEHNVSLQRNLQHMGTFSGSSGEEDKLPGFQRRRGYGHVRILSKDGNVCPAGSWRKRVVDRECCMAYVKHLAMLRFPQHHRTM